MRLIDKVYKQIVELRDAGKVPRVLRCNKMTFYDLEREIYGLSQPFMVTATPKLTVFGLSIKLIEETELLVTE